MLKIYRASAGSGKTYNLALEYLKLLFSSKEKDPYRRILAVTFTNKATAEMKQRIVQELFVLSHDVRRSKYFGELTASLRLKDPDLQRRAQEILFSLLHDFSSFNIDTIDRFFQQITRAFTREIGLQGGYNLEVDNAHVLEEAIDRMLFGLEDSSSRELLDWLLKFSEEKVEEAESWDIRRNIKNLSSEIFKETYKTCSRELLALTDDKAFLDAYKKDLLQIQRDFESELKELGKEGEQLMARFGLKASDFKQGPRSTFTHFSKWASGEIVEPKQSFYQAVGNMSDWYAKTAPAEKQAAICAAYEGGLNRCMENAIACFERYPRYLTAVESFRYFYTLGILSDVDRNVKAYEQEHNLLLLSDTTELLHRIIDGNDTPFIYEKTGTRIDHLMIDEFQDTSNMQWSNFEPLFKESLDKGNRCLIVGDVKQSIYRWRNSDWNLLHSGMPRAFDPLQLQNEHLNTNWRSASRIIDFNNALFQQSAAVLQQQLNDTLPAGLHPQFGYDFSRKIVEVYADICQNVSPSRSPETGRVSLSFKVPSKDREWKEQALDDIPSILRQLQDRGLQLRDIAFLVRKKEEGRLIADKLLACKQENTDPRYRFDVISDEALYLENSPNIKLIISILRYLQNPDSEMARTQAVYEYVAFQKKENPSATLQRCFADQERGESSLAAKMESIFNSLRTRSLFEMCEKIIEHFPSTDQSSQVYIQAFQDMVLAYTKRYSSDLSSFLQWWDEWGKNKTISTPSAQNAIRIMTIHQSKGLEFKAVIIPFCDWKLDNLQHTNILWCRPQEAPFNRLPLVPVLYSSKLEKTIYAKDYFNEKIYSYIDNLNLAYVAFTRAEEELILIAPKPKHKVEKPSSLSALLYHCVTHPLPESVSDAAGERPDGKESRNLMDLSRHYDDGTSTFELGQCAPFEVRTEQLQENRMPEYRSVDFKDRLQLRLYGKGFFGNQELRRYGVLMHEILSTIRTSEDLSAAVKPYVLSGQLTGEGAAEIAEHIREWVSSPEVSRWFAPDVQVLNEVEILQPDGLFYRPDRVVLSGNEVTVIDYKFGQVERESYHRQVGRYVSLIQKMGYASVTGYIWYVELSKIVQV